MQKKKAHVEREEIVRNQLIEELVNEQQREKKDPQKTSKKKALKPTKDVLKKDPEIVALAEESQQNLSTTATSETTAFLYYQTAIRTFNAFIRGELELETEADRRAALFFQQQGKRPASYAEFTNKSDAYLQEIKQEQLHLNDVTQDHEKRVNQAIATIMKDSPSLEEGEQRVNDYLDQEIKTRRAAIAKQEKAAEIRNRLEKDRQEKERFQQEKERLEKERCQALEDQSEQAAKELLEQDAKEKAMAQAKIPALPKKKK